MLYILSENSSSRLQYTCEVLFKHILQINYEIILISDTKICNKNPLINYTAIKKDFGIQIQPHSLLFEDNIYVQDLIIQHKNGVPYFFKTSKDGEVTFDIFASTFYMVSRYEEYLPFKPDVHGRFTAYQSLAYKAGFLQLPIVHLWVEELKKIILKHYPDFCFPTVKFSQFNTIDIDVAYAYRGKPFLRQLGGFFKSLLHFNFKELQDRLGYYFTGKDPFDSYNYIEKVGKNSAFMTYFFLDLGKHSKFDKNLPLNKTMRSLINRLSTIGTIGIHPSYTSNENPEELKTEINSLHSVVNQIIINSRQHYLRLRLPETYENLIKNGIQSDYTMGFAEEIGFRAGICVAYPFFNLLKNEIRPLTIVPFQIMDGTLKDYQNFTVEQALHQVDSLKKSIQEVNGTLVSIFHNSSLTDIREWKNWREVYETILFK